MNMFEYNTPCGFRSTAFIQLLNDNGIYAHLGRHNNVIFDRDALEAISCTNLPDWLIVNREHMLGNVCSTRWVGNANKPIDKMLYVLEQTAIAKGDDIDANTVYINVCEVVTDVLIALDTGTPLPDNMIINDAMDDLRDLFKHYGLDFNYHYKHCVGA